MPPPIVIQVIHVDSNGNVLHSFEVRRFDLQVVEIHGQKYYLAKCPYDGAELLIEL